MSFHTKFMPLAITLAFAGSASAQQVVKIGSVAPLTGPGASFGKDYESGATMAIDELNAQGFKINGKAVKFVLLSEDDEGDPKLGTTTAQKLVDAKVDGVIGHLTSGTTIPASRIYFNAGIPQISPAATNPQYTRQKFNTAFRSISSDNKLGAALGTYAVEKLQSKKIIVIDDRSAYGQGLADEFIKSTRKKGVSIIAREFTSINASDFSAILTTIKGKHPDTIFFGGIAPVGGPMLRQMAALDIKAKFLGGDGICDDSMAKLAGDAIGDGLVICAQAGGISGSQQKAMDDFQARYKKKYHAEAQLYAPYVYDAVMTMATAMADARSSEAAQYRPFLARIKYQGVTGLIAFDQYGDIQDGAVTLYTFKNGKKTKLEVIQ